MGELDRVQEKMYDFEVNKKNNLIFYGIPNEINEKEAQLVQKIKDLVRHHMKIRRDIVITAATRMHTGPEVFNCRPALVTFEEIFLHFNSLSLRPLQLIPLFKTFWIICNCNVKVRDPGVPRSRGDLEELEAAEEADHLDHGGSVQEDEDRAPGAPQVHATRQASQPGEALLPSVGSTFHLISDIYFTIYTP